MRNKSPYFPLTIDPSCVLAFLMEGEMSSGKLQDHSQYNNHGAITGAVFRDGVQGQGLSFDGDGDKIRATAIANLGVASSISCWIKQSDVSALSAIFGNSTSSNERLSLSSKNTQKFEFGHWDGATTRKASSDDVSVNGRWYHLVGTFNGTTAKLYVDGVLQSGTINPLNAGTVNLTIGAQTDDARDFGGVLDRIFLFNRVLTAREIHDEYSAFSGQ